MSRGCKARSRVRKGTSVRLGVPFPSPLALVGLPPPRWCACSRWRAWPPGPPPARVRRPSPTRWSHWASVMCECGDTWPGGDSPSSVPDLTGGGRGMFVTNRPVSIPRARSALTSSSPVGCGYSGLLLCDREVTLRPFPSTCWVSGLA